MKLWGKYAKKSRVPPFLDRTNSKYLQVNIDVLGYIKYTFLFQASNTEHTVGRFIKH